jgi:tetratricopeptide (TPR) repeat protein
LRGLLDWWHTLSQGARDSIIGTIAGGGVLAVVVAIFKLSGSSLKAGLRKLVGGSPNISQPVQPQSQRHEIVVRVEPPQPTPRIEEREPETSKPQPRPASGQASHNLPRPPQVGFVERRDKGGQAIVARLKDELAPQKNQLVALWGDGGVGKTTIAAEAARALIDAFAMGVVWTIADGRPDFALSTLLDEIATQLGEPEIRKLATEPKKEAVGDLIDHFDTPLLVVLDNFETISPDEQKLCAEWIAKDAHCPALITTRGRVDGARNVPIDVMSLSEANEFLDRVIAQTQDPRAFEGLNRNRIIEAAEANPLVMQWVIAQIDLAQRVGDVLDDLAHGEGDAAQRVFDRSFNLPQLGRDGRDTLLALSLFVPDASRPALAEVAGFGDDDRRSREAVGSMARLGLVETANAGDRLVIKGLTRDLARPRLSKDERAAEFRARFIAHFVGYVQSHSKTTKEDFDALELEKDNLLASMDVAFEMKDWKSVMRMAYVTGLPVTGFLKLRGYWGEGIRCNKQALEAARLLRNDSDIARFTHNLAVIYGDRGDLDEARRLYNESLEIAKRLGDQSGIACTLHQLGRLAEDQGKIDEARRLYNESLEIEKKLGDQSGIAISLHQLANLAQGQGEIDEARRLYNESLEISKRLGDQRAVASTLHQLAMLAHDQGEIDDARQFYNESLEIKKKLGDRSGIASTLHQLAMLAHDQGEIDDARQLYNESLEIKKKLGNQRAVASTLHQLAVIAQGQRETEEARRLYNESLVIEKKLGNQSGIASSLHQLGRLAEDEDNHAEAAGLFREALSIFEKLKSPNAEIARRSLERAKSKMK